MKKYVYIALLLLLGISLFQSSFADIINIPFAPEIEDVSVEYEGGFNGSLTDSANSLGFSILNTLKIILSGVLLIYIVYIGIQMVLSLGEDGEELSSAKRQLAYVLVALVFINIPGTLYNAFYVQDRGTIGELSGTWADSSIENNIFINSGVLYSVVQAIVGFMQALITGLAVIMLVIAGIRLIAAGSDEEQRSNATRRVIWSVVALLFVGFIELVEDIAISGTISGESGLGGLFGSIIDIALFFAAPIAMLFLTLAGYYYITSNGDEERVKKAKNIVVYTVIATILLIAIFTVLIDLAKLF